MSATSVSVRRQEKLVVLLLPIVLGITLRLFGLGTHSLWFDETMTVYIAKSTSLVDVLVRDRNPPLAFLAFGAWIGLFGESDGVLRLLPAIVSSCSLAVVAFGLRALASSSMALWATWFFASSPFLAWYAQEVRTYFLVELGTVLHMLGILAMFRSRIRPIMPALTVACGAFVAFGSNYTGYVLQPQALAAAIVMWRWRVGRPFLTIVSSLIGACLWAPWVALVLPLQMANDWGSPAWPSFRALLELPVRLLLVEPDSLSGPLAFIPWVLVVIIPVLLVRAVWICVRFRRPMRLAVGAVWLAPILAALLVAVLGWPMFGPRYLVASGVGACCVLGLTLALSGPCVRVVGCVFLGGSIVLIGSHRMSNLKEDFRHACLAVSLEWRPGDHVMTITGTFPGFSDACVAHYCRDRADIIASLVPEQSVDSASIPSGRLHVVFREAPYSWPRYKSALTMGSMLREEPMRNRVKYVLLDIHR